LNIEKKKKNTLPPTLKKIASKNMVMKADTCLLPTYIKKSLQAKINKFMEILLDDS
jgi:hypothetical protein